MLRSALVAGAHGILVEVHPEPEKALSDGPQSLTFAGFEKLMEEVGKLCALGPQGARDSQLEYAAP